MRWETAFLKRCKGFWICMVESGGFVFEDRAEGRRDRPFVGFVADLECSKRSSQCGDWRCGFWGCAQAGSSRAQSEMESPRCCIWLQLMHLESRCTRRIGADVRSDEKPARRAPILPISLPGQYNYVNDWKMFGDVAIFLEAVTVYRYIKPRSGSGIGWCRWRSAGRRARSWRW